MADANEEPTLDEKMIRVGAETPSFGGIALGESEEIIVYVLDETRLSEAEQVISMILGDAANRVQVVDRDLPSRYKNWSHEAHMAFIPGVTRMGYAEATGFTEIGISSLYVFRPLESKLHELGIPLEAILIEVESPAVKR